MMQLPLNPNNFEKIERVGFFSFLVKLHRPLIEKQPQHLFVTSLYQHFKKLN